jgi:sensor c-di-GMP phosphodiesterase-like protein
MKTLIATALMIISISSFGAELGAVDSFLSVLPVGEYSGHDDKGVDCSVSVTEVNFPAKALLVTANNNEHKSFKVIKDGSEFLFRAYKQEFIQTDRYYVDASRNSFVEKIVRTVNAGINRLYVVVARETTVNRERTVEAVECVVNQKL